MESKESKEALRKHRLLRGQCKATITRLGAFVEDPISFASATIDVLEARKEKLISALKSYEAVQLDILSIDENDTEEVGILEERYYSVLAKINASLKQIGKVSVSQCHNVSTCKLPTIDITPYDGKDFTKFKPFYDLFMAVIDNNRSLSDVQKLFYLRKYVTDDALAVIVNLPLVNQSYREALGLLEKRFDNKTRLIGNHISVLLDLPTMQKGTAASIRCFVSDVQQQLHALKNLGQPIDTWDMLLISILTRKLDQITNRAYQLDRDLEKMPSMADLLNFLEKRAIALEDSLPPKGTCYESTNRFYKSTPSKVTNVASNVKKMCKHCNKSDHPLFSCPEFKTAALEVRKSFVRDHDLCTTCLKTHSGKCKFNFKCQICKLGHNTLLHEQQPVSPIEPAVTLLSNPVSDNILLPTVKVNLQDQHGEIVSVRALLDTGSQASFVTTSLVNKLGLIAINQNHNIIGIGNKQTQINKFVKISVLPCHNNVKLNLKCHIVDQITLRLPQQFINVSGWNLPQNVKLSDDEFNIPAEISLLLGADVYFNVLLDGCIKIPNGPVLQNTLFGYVVGGNIPVKVSENNKVSNVTCEIVSNFAISDHKKLENVMENFWLSEKVPEPVKQSCDEFVKAEESFQSSMSLKNNRFQVDMPLITPLEELQLGDSFSVAYQRFLMLEKRFKTNPLLLEQYKLFIDQYVELGHAKKVDIANYDINKDPVYFLAHHAVINEASKTTRLRVVFDGSMKSRSQVSLNDVMLNGPVVQSELFDILILFRTFIYTIICDIQKAFRNVFINSHHTCLQNILWRDDPTKPISCLQLQTVTYGLKASTFLTTRCLLELAHRYKDRYPLATQTMIKSTYVDDVLGGSDNLEQLHELKSQLVELLKLGSFSLHKWCSNSLEVLDGIPDEQKQFENIDMSGDNLVKTLGLMYDVTSDTFTFSSPNFSEEHKLNTKRKILSFIGKMFDPLGLIGPIIVVAKIFMQELWSLQIGWDSIVPEEQFLYWNNFLNNLKLMGKIKINRCVNRKEVSSVELVGYSDASIKAFGCCLYLRILKNDGTLQTELLCSKSRVAPLSKNLTIPQLELNGALLLAQLAHRVGRVIEGRFPQVEKFFYSDSQIVLAWIKSGNVKSNVYANNRVKQIVELTDQTQWGFVRTSNNPADLLSRGVLPHKLQQNELWWYGPTYLLDEKHKHTRFEYCKLSDLSTDTKQINEPLIPCNSTQVEPSVSTKLFDKYSSVYKLQKVIGYIYRFYKNCSKKFNKIMDISLTPQELRDSMLVIVRCTQMQHFGREVESLSSGKNIKTGIGSLYPFLDKIGIIRVGGRLHNAKEMSFDKKHPVILPKNCHITNLIIEREHLRLLHAGPRLVLSSLSQRYSIVSGIREVKKVVRKCVKCFRLKAEAAKQLMGSLPQERITASRPFQHVGVDFCGPFDMKVARVRKPIVKKGYIALFVCFAIKAIHVELVSDLTTEAFLACLKRFISRRGMPTNIFCDNAKTFKGASNEMKKLYELQSSKNHRDNVNGFCSQHYIKFRFIPSYSPEFGGLWEAGVKSVKHHLKRVVGNQCLTYEELNTVIVQIEGILNSRPLLSANSNDCSYLTPAHFLIGTALASYPEVDLTNVSVNRLKFWNLCTKLKQDFWKLWSNDYLTQLQSRPKWKYPQPNLKEGDLVIVKDLNTTPLNYNMARIVKTYPGRDNVVRAADIKMNNKVYRRSVKRLCQLPVE